MDNPLGLTTCPPFGAHLPTGGSPTGLTPFGCLAPVGALFNFQMNTECRGLAPLLPDGGGWSFGESFALVDVLSTCAAFP